MSNNNKALTLVEIIVASTLTIIVITGVTAGISFMFTAHKKLEENIEKNEKLMYAVEHLKRHIKDSSYCAILSSGETLKLYDSGKNQIGIYTLSNRIFKYNNLSRIIFKSFSACKISFIISSNHSQI